MKRALIACVSSCVWACVWVLAATGATNVLCKLIGGVIWDWRFVSSILSLLCLASTAIVDSVPLHDQPVC